MQIGIGIGTSMSLRRGVAFDPDAATYIAAVEAADEQELEPGVKQAIDGFVTGCKADGIWTAIKASCILAGARTLNGCLVPLKGTAPTNFNFVSADYNRITGLKGDGNTKYINTNRSAAADPRNSYHQVVGVRQRRTGSNNAGIIGAGLTATGTSHIYDGGTALSVALGVRNRTSSAVTTSGNATGPFIGAFRKSATNVVIRSEDASVSYTGTSQAPIDQDVVVFGRNLSVEYDGRLDFYSIGEDCDEAAFNNRYNALMTAISEALS